MNTQASDKQLWENWFDSPFYHILYKNRDEQEAEFFIDRLFDFLRPEALKKTLDLACGKGRHSVYMRKKGLDVWGIDLSENSIKEAKRLENEHLKFFVHDMRQVFRAERFDYVFNLFTSMGYMDSDEENLQVLQAAADNLKPGGLLIIDFMNPVLAERDLIHYELKSEDGIRFKIVRKLENRFFWKDIFFMHQDRSFHFQEKVRYLAYQDFLRYFEHSGLRLVKIFGNYSLAPFQFENSERMIFIAQK